MVGPKRIVRFASGVLGSVLFMGKNKALVRLKEAVMREVAALALLCLVPFW